MARNKNKVHTGTLFSTLFVISLAMLFLPHSITKNLNFFFIELFKPMLSIGKEGPAYLFRPGNPADEYVSREEYDKLWTAYKNIEADLYTLQDEYSILAKYRPLIPDAGSAIVPAAIITFKPSEYLVIDRGSEHGIEAGQYVLGGETIVGKVIEVSPASSRVELLTNINSIIQVRIWREGDKKYITANMNGTGLGDCRISLIPRENDIRKYDSVYASPKPGFLASPRIIGEVVDVWPAENDPLLWDVTVKPLYDADVLNDVAVIIANPKEVF